MKESGPEKIILEQNQDSEIKKESTPELLPEKFEALVVLGEGWREHPPKNADKDWSPRLSIESKMSSLAAGEMFKAGLIDKIIFSTGKTIGKDQPSESRLMCDYLKKNYPEITDDRIILEEESIDTVENVEEVLKIVQKQNIENIALMTPKHHLARSMKIFNNYGLEPKSFPPEEMIKKRSPHYEKFIENYLGSGRVRKKKIKETVLRGLLAVDTKGKLLRIMTKKRNK